MTRPALAIGVAMAVIAIIASFFKAPPVREAPAVITLTREGVAATSPPEATEMPSEVAANREERPEATAAAAPPSEAKEAEADLPTREAEAITLTPAPRGTTPPSGEAAAGAAKPAVEAAAAAAPAADEPSPLPIRSSEAGSSRVQVASFKTRDFADRLVTRLAREGISASIDQSGDFYRVLAGPYADEAAAATAAKRIAEVIKQP